MLEILGFFLCAIAGALSKYYGGFPAFGAVLLGEIGIGMIMFGVSID